MRLLIFNHFFDQDISALVKSRGQNSVYIVPFQYFRRKASRVLGRRISDGTLEEFNRSEHYEARRKWERKSHQIFNTLYDVFKFDLFIVPSDTFFYIRDFIQICQHNGIPVVVLQKETTISPHTMEEHSRRIGREFPFISDKMLVCSTRQRQFWLNAGTDPSAIEIIGQPRFDVYANRRFERNWKELGLPIGNDEKVILFFSYDLDAYAPDEVSSSERGTWSRLRHETEEAFLRLTNAGYVVLVKPHPQQRSRLERKALARRMKPVWNKRIFWVDRVSDARYLILHADVVVGFQTTALYEAMLAGKPVIYTHWSDAVKKFEDKLIPFWKCAGALTVVRSPDEFVHAVLREDTEINEQTMDQRRQVAVDHIGEIDGLATSRAWREIDRIWLNTDKKPVEALQRIHPSRSRQCCRYMYASFLSKANVLGCFLVPVLYFALSSLSNIFPALSTGSKSNRQGLKNRFKKFAGFWDDFKNQASRHLRNR